MPENHVDSTLNTHSNQSTTPTIDSTVMLRGLLANLSVEQIQSILPKNLIVSDVEVVTTPSVYKQVENCIEYYSSEADEEELFELKIRLANCGLFGVEKRHLIDALNFGTLSLSDCISALDWHCNHLHNSGSLDAGMSVVDEVQNLRICISKLTRQPNSISTLNDLVKMISELEIVKAHFVCSTEQTSDLDKNLTGLTEVLLSIDIPTSACSSDQSDIESTHDSEDFVMDDFVQKKVDKILKNYLPSDILACLSVDSIQDFLTEDHDKLIFSSEGDMAKYLKEEDYLVFESNVEAKDHLETDSEFLVFDDVDEAKDYLQENEGLNLYDSDDVDTLVAECLTVVEEKIREQMD